MKTKVWFEGDSIFLQIKDLDTDTFSDLIQELKLIPPNERWYCGVLQTWRIVDKHFHTFGRLLSKCGCKPESFREEEIKRYGEFSEEKMKSTIDRLTGMEI